MKQAELRNWQLTSHTGLVPPEDLHLGQLRGQVFHRPLYNDGTVLSATAVVGLKDDLLVTQSMTYKFGDADPEYESKFPGSRQRLLKLLKKL